MAAMTFALGGLASWMPTFFARERGMPLAEANSLFGAVTVGAGLIGTFVGGWLGDRLLQRTRAAYLLVSGAGMLLALPATWLALTLTDRALSMGFIFVAEVLVFLNTGPANAVLVNVALPEIRATAIAVSIFVFHLLGDVPSPILIGWVSDRSGLQTALLGLSLLAMAASGVLYLWGSRSVAEDSERVERAVRERESEHARADQDTA
jgi:sugar phosphate permease